MTFFKKRCTIKIKMRTPYRRSPKVAPDPTNPYEDDEAFAFHDWLSINRIPHNHRPNEGGSGNAGRARSMKMKRQGVSAGAWDYEIFVPQVDGTYRQVEVELKRRKGGTVSEAQKAWQKIYEGAGIPCKICKGWEEAAEFVKSFMPIVKRVEF